MLFTPTKLKGAFAIAVERREDERGFFARTWCQQEFEQQELDVNLAQCSISFNHKKATLRGMHLQMPPRAETKLVRCTQGAIYDVIIDLRQDSETYLQWFGIELTAENRQALYIPKGFAHGFQTLEDNTEVFYQISEFYAPECSRGLRWNDPVFNIVWPEPVSVISARDRDCEDYNATQFPLRLDELS
jgi:dTDP-4-dehydrorhamnose 3,5-epimerase